MRYFSSFTGTGGFDLAMPSDWECVGFSEIDAKGNKVEISDTQRYKMAGNGVVSNVIKWIVENVILNGR